MIQGGPGIKPVSVDALFLKIGLVPDRRPCVRWKRAEEELFVKYFTTSTSWEIVEIFKDQESTKGNSSLKINRKTVRRKDFVQIKQTKNFQSSSCADRKDYAMP